MADFPVPTPADQQRFLLRLYFGSESDRLAACVQRAYHDLNRTLHGLAKLPDRKVLHQTASEHVHSALVELVKATFEASQSSFDAWHEATCEQLCAVYAAHGFSSFCIGQAQKWVNMAFKYVHVFGEQHLPGYGRLYMFGHVPLDNVILEKLCSYGAPRLSAAWSRVRRYDEYMGLQRWIRQKFAGSAPLAVEFQLWQAQ